MNDGDFIYFDVDLQMNSNVLLGIIVYATASIYIGEEQIYLKKIIFVKSTSFSLFDNWDLQKSSLSVQSWVLPLFIF